MRGIRLPNNIIKAALSIIPPVLNLVWISILNPSVTEDFLKKYFAWIHIFDYLLFANIINH